jgi:hypothetical protein
MEASVRVGMSGIKIQGTSGGTLLKRLLHPDIAADRGGRLEKTAPAEG